MYRHWTDNPIAAGFRLAQQALVNLDGDTLVKSGSSVTEFPNQGTGGADYDLDVVVGTGANLRESLSDAMLMYGGTGDYASSPDSAAMPSGSADFIVYVQPDDWTPTPDEIFIAKYTGVGTQRTFAFKLDATGQLQLTTYNDGTTNVTSFSTVPTGIADGVGAWVRAALDMPGQNVNFYTSFDSPLTSPSAVSWTLLGDPDVAHIQTSLFDSTAPVVIGCIDNGASQLLNGSVYRAAIYNGIGGTLAVDFNAADYVNRTSDTEFNSIVGSELWDDDPDTVDSGWTDNGDGTYTCDGTNAASVDLLTAGTSDNNSFTFSFDVTGYVSGDFRVYLIGDSTRNPATSVSANGSFEFTMQLTSATGLTPKNAILLYSESSFIGTVGNISVKQVTPWTLNGDTYIQNTGHSVVHSIGSAGLESTAGQDIDVPLTTFLVGRFSNSNPISNQAFFGAKSDGAKQHLLFADSSNSDKLAFNAGTKITTSGAHSTEAQLVTIQANGDATTSVVSTQSGFVTGDAGSENWQFSSLFTDVTATNSMEGYIARLIVFDRALTENEIVSIQNYLASKYAL